MDFAVASGQMAGQAAMRALDAGDTSAAGLASYKEAMEGSFVIQDLRTFSKWPHVVSYTHLPLPSPFAPRKLTWKERLTGELEE